MRRASQHPFPRRDRVYLSSLLFAIALLVGLAEAQAAPKTQTVAVMPFRDLSGGSKFIGEAIRETVTSDLKQLGSLRVVERGSLDKILSEQHLQSQRADMDVATVVKLGKVLGASLIVIGAYQKLTPQVRLTARFIKVETSEVIGTAKVDGNTKEFLRLQDRITSSLLRSAGFAVHAKQILDDAEKRPDLASLKTLELYGQAVTATNDGERLQYLTLAVIEDKNFSYAVKDLEELEKRLKQYAAAALEVQKAQLQSMREKLRTSTDRQEIENLTYKIVLVEAALHHHHTVVREARAFFEALPKDTIISTMIDGIATNLMASNQVLRDWDSMLRDGESFLKRAPASQVFDSVKHYVEGAIREKRRIADGEKTAEEDVAKVNSVVRWDLCHVAQLYARNSQYDAAARLFDACFSIGTHPRTEFMSEMALQAFLRGDWPKLRKLLTEWEFLDAKAVASFRKTYDPLMPTDE